MSSNVKHTNKMRKCFREVVEQCGGSYATKRCKGGIKDVYIVGDAKVVYVWHTSPSCNDIVIYSTSNLNHLARRLGVYEAWSTYANENTIYMHPGLIGDVI